MTLIIISNKFILVTKEALYRYVMSTLIKVIVKQKPNPEIIQRAVSGALRQIRNRLEESTFSSENKIEKLVGEK